MKTLPLFPVGALAIAMLVAPVRAADPQPAAVSPELQALVMQLLQGLNAAQAEPPPVPAATPAAAANPAPKSSPFAASSLQTGRLTTRGLTTSSLAPSASLGGRGTSGGVPRLTDDDWRLLFPVKQLRP